MFRIEFTLNGQHQEWVFDTRARAELAKQLVKNRWGVKVFTKYTNRERGA